MGDHVYHKLTKEAVHYKVLQGPAKLVPAPKNQVIRKFDRYDPAVIL